MLPEIFGWNDPKSRFPFTFQLGFRETFCDGKQLRDGPLKNLWGGGGRAKYKKIFAQGKIEWKKIHAPQLTLKNIHATA